MKCAWSGGKFRIHRHHQMQIGTDAFGGTHGTNHKPATQLTRASKSDPHQILIKHDDVHHTWPDAHSLGLVTYFMMCWDMGRRNQRRLTSLRPRPDCVHISDLEIDASLFLCLLYDQQMQARR